MFYQVKWELLEGDLANTCDSYRGFPVLPPSKYCNSMDPEFISFRQELLGKFLDHIANVPFVDQTPSFLEFGSPADGSNPRIFSWESRENLFVEHDVLDSQVKTQLQHRNLTRALFANTDAYRVETSSLEGAVEEIKSSSFDSTFDEVQSAIESVVEAVADSPMMISRTLNLFDASDKCEKSSDPKDQRALLQNGHDAAADEDGVVGRARRSSSSSSTFDDIQSAISSAVDAVVDSPRRISRALNLNELPHPPITTSQRGSSGGGEGGSPAGAAAEHKTKCRALLDQGSITVEEYRELVLVEERAAILIEELQFHRLVAQRV